MQREPLYLRVKADLLTRIDEGEWTSNDYLPSEQALIDYYRVSRTTVRKAISDLVSQGVLLIERGNGTKLAPRLTCVESMLSFTDMMHADQRKAGIADTTVTLQVPDVTIAEILHLHPTESALHFRRVHTADDQPISVSQSWLDQSLFAALSLESLSKQESLYAHLASLGRPISVVSDSFSVEAIDGQDAHDLDLDDGSPVLTIHRCGYDRSGVLIEYGLIYVRSDRFQPQYTVRRNA